MGVDKLLTKVFGSSNQRYLKSIQPIVDQINELEPAIKKLSDEQLRARTAEFKEQLQRAVAEATDPEDRKRRERDALDEILPEAFAIVREASVRTTGMRHFDVQLIGGIVLHQGRIAEMRTGEGKTLVATLPAYLNSLTGRGGVHVITVNDYLASRDAEWMGQIHRFLGLEVGCIQNDMDDFERQAAYAADITYGTNNEFGFDYLRDNMKFDLATCVQRGHYFAIVDEVDSILIEQALKAHTLYRLDHQYVVQDGEVIIVDDFTGRLMKGRRWSDGLHQAVEAKEGVKIEKENQTLATITLQNYFRLYEKLSGMTGTAETEAAEFHSTYKLDVIMIPTHMPMVRKDNPDMIYRTLPEKWDAVVEEIKERYVHGQPVLVGTVSVENSELIARRLQRVSVPHNVLNAKYHEREAEIVAQAGRKGAITIATNMAGRGADNLLGGNPDFMAREFLKEQEIDPDEATDDQWREVYARAKRIVESEHKEVVSLGGLHLIGTERHESRRIDNQLRGRAGRQGDPGSSRILLSLEDDLMRIFAGDKVKALMQRLGMEKGVAIESKMVSKRIESAQKSVEGRNFESRKHLLEYDDVMNKQRETVYGLRRQLMEQPDQREYLMGETGVARDLLADITAKYLNSDVAPDDWDVENYKVQIRTIYALDPDAEGIDFKESAPQQIEHLIWEKLKAKYAEKEKQIGEEAMRTYERIIMLNIIDAQWKDHLLALDHLKQGIGLVGYGQKDPLVEYKKESFAMFEAMLDRIDTTTLRSLFNLQVVAEQPPEAIRQRRLPRRSTSMSFTGPNQGAAAAGVDEGKG